MVVTAAAMGGGGYWYLRSQAAPSQGTAPQPAAPTPSPDETISGAVKSALAAVPQLQSLQVAVQGGVVTLDGSVPTQALADQAVRIASAQPSVKDVRNQIDFPPVAVAAPAQPLAVETPVRATPQTRKPAPGPAAAKPPRERKPEAPGGLSPQQRRRLQELLADGERLTNSGAYAAAIDTYNSALAIDPSDASAKAGLSRARQAKATEEEILLRRRK